MIYIFAGIGIGAAVLLWLHCKPTDTKKMPLVGCAQARQMYNFNRRRGLLGSAEPDYQGNESVYCTYRGDSDV